MEDAARDAGVRLVAEQHFRQDGLLSVFLHLRIKRVAPFLKIQVIPPDTQIQLLTLERVPERKAPREAFDRADESPVLENLQRVELIVAHQNFVLEMSGEAHAIIEFIAR